MGLWWLGRKSGSEDLSLESLPTRANGHQPYVSQRHPEAMSAEGLLHHRAITINFNYMSLLAAELWKNNKEVKKKKRQKRGSCNPGEFFQADCQHSRFPRAFVSREKAPDKEMERTGRLFFFLLK